MATDHNTQGSIMAGENLGVAKPLSSLATHPTGLVAFPTQAGLESLPARIVVAHNDLGTFALGDRVFCLRFAMTAWEGLEP